MATANPLEEILNSEIDESAISALVGSLESQFASPTPKDTLQQNLTTSLNRNHHCSEQDRVLVTNAARNDQISAVAPSLLVANTTVIAGQKPPLPVDCIARVPSRNTNGSNISIAPPSQLSSVNSLVAPVTGAVTLGLSNVNTCGGVQAVQNLMQTGHTPPVPFNVIALPKPDAKLATGLSPSNVHRHVIVTVGSTNSGTIGYQTVTPNCVNIQHLNTSTPPLISTHVQNVGVTNVTNSLPGNPVYNLANAPPDQMPITLPVGADGMMLVGNRLAVQEQLDKQKDAKAPQQVVVNVVNTAGNVSQQHIVTKPESAAGVKPEVKFVTQPPNMATMHVMPNASTNVITITNKTLQAGAAQTVKVVRAPAVASAVQPHMQIVNVNPAIAARMVQPAQKPLAPRIPTTSSIRIAAAPQAIPMRTPGGMVIRGPPPPHVPGTITLPPGYQLMKNEQGQFVVVSGGPAQSQIVGPAAINVPTSGQPAFKINAVRPATITHAPRQAASVPMTTGAAPITIVTAAGTPHPQQIGHHHPAAVASVPAAAAAAAVAMQDNVKKCKNFLTALINLAASQPADIVKNVRKLVQALVDGKVEPDEFTTSLQVELKSSSTQPYLIPFLKKSLPHLRQSMMLNHIHIDGIRPPPRVPAVPVAPSAAVMARIGAQQQQFQPLVSQGMRLHKAGTTAVAAAAGAVPPRPYLQNLMYQRRLQLHAAQKAGAVVTAAAAGAAAPGQTKALLGRAGTTALLGRTTAAAGLPQRHVMHARLARPSAQPAATTPRNRHTYESLKEDDDINDVATMGGVNLSEESQNILATNSALMTGQLRSCRDEHFLASQALAARINALARRHGLDDVPQSVVGIISHATQERLRNIIEKLSIVSEHRLEIHKTNSRYEVTTDVKSQLKFLEELDRMENKRHDETEREVLLRAARSRSKHEDPEQLKLKEKAKALQLAEMEEVRQREANLTALAAIGPRKKRKLDAVESSGSSTSLSSSQSGESNSRTSVLRPRIRRVNLRDLLFVLEQERDTSNSLLLYKSLLK